MAKKVNHQPELTDIVFRERIDGGKKELAFSDVGLTSDYLLHKLTDAPPGIEQGDFLEEGFDLMNRVQEAFVEGGYPYCLKADIADYLSNAMKNLLNIDNLDGKQDYIVQLQPENRNDFSYGAQVVDALIKLAIQTGVIRRKSASPWKNLKKTYKSEGNDDAIKDAYQSLAFMRLLIEDNGKKNKMLAQIEKEHAATPIPVSVTSQPMYAGRY